MPIALKTALTVWVAPCPFRSDSAFGKYSLASSNSGQSWEDIFTGSLEAGLSQTFTPNLYSIFTYAYTGYRSGYLENNHLAAVLRDREVSMTAVKSMMMKCSWGKILDRIRGSLAVLISKPFTRVR